MSSTPLGASENASSASLGLRPRCAVDPKDDFLRHLPLEDESFSVLLKENLKRPGPGSMGLKMKVGEAW